MDELILILFVILGVLFVLAILPIIAIVKVSNLRTELTRLKKQVRKLEAVSNEPVKAATPVRPEPLQIAPSAAAATSKIVIKETIPEKVVEDATLSKRVYPPLAPKHSEPAEPVVPATPAEPTFFDRLIENAKENWLIWLGGLSLATGGLFIVQYGIERGFLGPLARVIVAMLFGAGLIAYAERLRRQRPDQRADYYSATAALAAGGVATLFAAVVSAHLLYGFTNATVGFLSMAAVAFLAIGGGLIYGPVLAVIGILGAFVSPLLVTSSEPNPIMYLYFLVVLAAALVVERWQRWIWLSSFGVGVALAWGLVMHSVLPTELYLGFYALGIIVLVTCVPAFNFPVRSDSTDWLTIDTFDNVSSRYPTILAVITTGAAVASILFASKGYSIALWQTNLLILLALFAYAALFLRRAENLDQYAGVFALGLVAMVGFLANGYLAAPLDDVNLAAVRASFPYALIGFGFVLATVLAILYLRLASVVRPLYWVLLAAVMPTSYFGLMCVTWIPLGMLDSPLWPNLWMLMAIGLSAYLAVCAYLTWLADKAKIATKATSIRFGVDVLASVSLLMLGFAALIGFDNLYISTGLTLTFAALAGLSYLVTQRFSFVLTNAVSILFTGLTLSRLMVAPGFIWAIEQASYTQVLTVFCGAILICSLAFVHAHKVSHESGKAQFETTAIAALAVLVVTLLGKWAFSNEPFNYSLAGMFASTFGVFSLVQFYRRDVVSGLKWLRNGMGFLYLGLSTLALIIAMLQGPLLFDLVEGFFPVDTVVLAYIVPAALLLAGVFFKPIPQVAAKPICFTIAAALAGWTLVLEIRRFWHGPDITFKSGADLVMIGELYTYTIVMLLLTMAVIFMSVLKKDALLKQIGLTLALVTAAKVFFWDMAGLYGLGRATAFIALGLTLAGLAAFLQRFGPSKEETANVE